MRAHTRRLSSVKRTATPASTLPTVKETSMSAAKRSGRYLRCCCGGVEWSQKLGTDGDEAGSGLLADSPAAT